MEWWQHSPSPITEVGITITKAKDLFVPDPVTSINILDLIEHTHVYHARVKESLYMINTELAGRAAHFFRFGASRWVSGDQAKEFVNKMFTQWKCADGTVALVILLGHGLQQDIKNLKKQYDIDLESLDNIVYIMQTLPLAKEAMLVDPNVPRDQGTGRLDSLMKGFSITHPIDCMRDAGNDIAYATIVALLIGLKDHLFPNSDSTGYGYPPKTTFNGVAITDIIGQYMASCKDLPAPTWGTQKYCYICEDSSHNKIECTVKFEPCRNCDGAGGPKNIKYRKKAKHHPTHCCSFYPNYHYEPLPDWVVEKLSKKQHKKFELAKAMRDENTLGALVLAAYPAVMKDLSGVDKTDASKDETPESDLCSGEEY